MQIQDGDEYSNMKMVKHYGNGIAIYKEPDYDYDLGPYAEKLWSILGKLMLPNCKIPHIDIIRDKRIDNIVPGTMSYSIVDKENEDMTDFRTILRYNGISEEEMKKQDDRLYIEELLAYTKNFVQDGENYKELEENIIRTILLDCITNGFDRHPDNWAIVRDNRTGKYKLGLFDNTVSFVNIISTRPGVITRGNWGKIFIRVKDETGKISCTADDVIKYINKKYPKYLEKFSKDLDSNLDKFNEQIENYQNGNVKKELMKKNSFLKNLYREERDF